MMNKLQKELLKGIEKKLISEKKHPTEDLWIYNYTPKCQFDKLWDKYTMMCRGLILNKEGEIVARPFKKFFNFGEIEGKLPKGDFKVYDKLDGSLGILYWIGEEMHIATRGSFESEQAITGTAILRTYERKGEIHLDKSKTYLFEILYPENRIVVNYGDKQELILLAVIDTRTGEEEDPHEYNYNEVFPVVEEFKGFKYVNELEKEKKDNAEGYVIKWPNNFRMKIKFDEYVRLHRLITGVNERRIWDMMRNEQSLDELLQRVPDEFYAWVRSIKYKFKKRFANLRDKSREIKRGALKLNDRKEQADYVFNQKDGHMLSGIVFAMIDGKDWKNRIWKILRPEATKPFKIEI